MKRHPALIKLSREHHSGLMLAQLTKKGSPKYKNMPQDINSKLEYTLSVFSDEILPHFRFEENILIPFIRGKDNSIDKLSTEILNEHEKIYSIINSLSNNEDILENLYLLGELLDSHIRKEERDWFERIQLVLTNDELEELGRRTGQ